MCALRSLVGAVFAREAVPESLVGVSVYELRGSGRFGLICVMRIAVFGCVQGLGRVDAPRIRVRPFGSARKTQSEQMLCFLGKK